MVTLQHPRGGQVPAYCPLPLECFELASRKNVHVKL
jgi:hypothetical protein